MYDSAVMRPNPVNQFRLQQLLKLADNGQVQTYEHLNRTQLEAARQRVAFFEKIAIGSGATIAALVSFLGTHAAGLHPHWILRCSLVSLVVAIVAALYRNFRYSNYSIATNYRQWLGTAKYAQERQNDVFQTQQPITAIQTGKPLDLAEWTAQFNETDAKLGELNSKERKREGRLWREWRTAEIVCLVAVSVAMIALVWLALYNF
jgi:lysylphosphatidylglycerol synthetase-like protein (DUF2156 family)